MTLMMRDLENQEMGAEKERKSIIEEMLRKGKEPHAIADFCGFPIKLIQEVQDNMMVTQ